MGTLAGQCDKATPAVRHIDPAGNVATAAAAATAETTPATGLIRLLSICSR